MATAPRPALERDPVKLDPKHYKVELETDRFRIVRINYGPNEKSPTHQHLPGVAVMLTDADFKFTYPDGRRRNFRRRQGNFSHLRNLGNTCPKTWPTNGLKL
jgi:predicted metal-dependent enzyme (double-stranded beta helix superfamily)